ncbi:hypothetical protein V5N11_012210 [Cardamine amara subsp. amara]|uniref:Titin-like n=1 Tax=Cardamine amara subsp. amara TaxID=228776 RepID=A0ABD1BC83_CARAN
METGVVTIQEPVSTKTNIEEAPAEVILDHSSIKVDKVNLSTVLDDEITSRDCENSTIPVEADVVNGSGNKETEESEHEKGEAMKTNLVEEDNNIVKEKASETEKDEQSSIFVNEPESFNKEIEDAKIILSNVTLEKEDDVTQKPEEAREEIPIKTDEVKEEKDSRTVETSVNGTEAEQKATVSVEEISRNGENIVNETVEEQETATNSESLDGVETTKRVLLEVKEEEEEEAETDAEPLIKTVVEEANIVSNEETTAHESKSLKETEEPVAAIKNTDDAEQISSEVTVDEEKEVDITQNTEEVQESVRVIETPTIQGEDIESKASLENEEEIDKISKDTEEYEHELVRDIPQGETFVTEAETVDTSTVLEAEILKTNVNETEENSAIGGEEEGQETKENTKLSQDLKEDKEQEETEMVKTIISSDEVRSCDVQVEEFGEHIEPRSLDIKDESHGREESVEVKNKETVQEGITEEKYENLHDVASLESEKYQDNKPETSLVANTESKENFEDIPSDLAVNVDKEELKDEKINVDQVDGTQIMEEQRGFDPNEPKAEQIDQNRTDETEEIPVAKLVALSDVESVEQIQKPSLESPSEEVSEETKKTIDEKIEEKPESKELGEQAYEERTLIDLTPLQEESCLPNEQEKETKLEVSSALPSKELVGETVVEAEKIENIEENEEEQVADKIQKSVETVESHSSLPSSLEEKELGSVPEKIEEEKVKEEEPMVHIKSEEDGTKIHEKQEESSKAGEETTVVQAEQTSLTEKCSMDQPQPEECFGDEQKKEVSRNNEIIENETYASHSAEVVAEEETAKKGESPLHDVETTKRVLLEVEKEEEEAETTDAEPSLDVIEKEEAETVKTIVEEAKIVNSEETTAHESESLKGDDHHDENAESVETIKNSDDAEQNRETEEDITQKTEKVQEISKEIETPTLQGEDIESKASPDHEEEVDQSPKDIEEHELVLGGDIPQCETLEAEAVEVKEDTKPILEKEDIEQELTETAKRVIFSDEVRPSDQVEVQAEEFGEHTEPCSSEIKDKDESHGREESVKVKSKEIVQDESTEQKHENLLDVPSTESVKYQDNEPETSLVANTESKEKFEEVPSDLVLEVDKEELKDEEINVNQVDETQIMEEQRGLDSSGAEAEQVDENRADETEESPVTKLVVLPEVESVEQIQKPSLESPSQVIEETSKTVDENIEEKSEEETVLVPEESSKPNEQDKETVLEKHEPTNEEVSSESFKGDDNKAENAESVEAIKTSDDAEQISSEVTGDIEKEEDIAQKEEEVQESLETPRANIEIKEEVDHSSKDTEEHELVLGRDIPQCDQTLEAEDVDTTTVQEAAILKTLETNINETEAVHSEIGEAEEIQETKEDTEVKDERQVREETVETKSKETVQDENSEEKDVNLLDVESGESEKCQENEPETTLVPKIESQEKFEEIPSDLALKDELKDEKQKADQVDETQTMEVQRGLDLNEPEAEQNDQNRADETEENPVAKLVVVEDFGLDETTHNQTLLDVESVENVQKPSLETPHELSEETSKTLDAKIEDTLKEKVTFHQEDQEESSYGLETKEETVSVPEESCLSNEQENEIKLQEKNEPTKEEVSNDQQSPVEETSDEVIHVSSAPTSEEQESETVVEAEKIEDKKLDEEEQVAEKIQKSLETVETVEPHSSFQEHESVSEKIDDEKVKEVEPMGDMSERGLEISEKKDLSIPSVDQNKDIKAFDEEILIPSVALPLDEQENVTLTETEETKENETAEAKKEDEQKEVCIQQEEFGKLEVPKLEESKEDKSQENVETIKAIEATSDQILPIETSDADNTLSSELVLEEKDQTPKLVEEIHEEQTEEAHKLQAEEIFPIEIIPRESSDEALVSMLASREDNQVTLQDDKREDDIKETKDTQEERSVSVEIEESVEETKPKEFEDEHVETPASPIILEKNDNETLIVEAEKGDEDINETETTMALDTSGTSAISESVCIKQEEFGNQEAPKLEESKEEKSQNISETTEAKEATSDQTLPIETSQEDQTLSSELVSRVDDQTPRHVEEIHEEETKEERKFEAIVDQSLPVETSQECQTPTSDLASELDDQTPKQVDEEETKEEHKLQVEVDEEETKEEHLQVEVDQILPVETSQEDQTPSLVKEILEEETKEVQSEDTVQGESFSEAPVSMLASGEDEPVTMQEGNYAGDDTQKEQHVSAEIEEKVVETKPKEPEAEETEKSNDQVETSNKLTEVEDENAKKTDTEVAELTDYSTGEAEQEDENSSNLPVVEILKGLHQLPLETERELNDSTSSGENVIIEPADQEQKKGDAEVESNEKDSASDIIEEVKVQDGISREFDLNVEETREIAESKEEVPVDLSLTELLPVVKILSCEKQEEHESQEDVNASISEKISLQEEQKEEKEETHETVKEEDETIENKEEKKSEEEQDEKLWDSSATRDIEEIFSSEVKDDKEVHSVLGSEEEINEVVISEKKITDPVGLITKAREAEHESNEEHIETQVITEQAQEDQRDEVSSDKSLTKEALVEQIQVTSSALVYDQDLSVKKPSELIQPHQSPNQVEETSFEVKKAEEDKNEENANALIINENVQVQDQPKDFEASATDKETSEQEQKSNVLNEDIGTNVKLEVHDDEVRCDSHDSVAESKEETGLIEEKKEIEHVKTELEDTSKHGISVEEKNNTSEKIDREAAKETNQEESKQKCTVKEEIREEEKETNQECFKKTDDVIDLTQTETRDIESLSSVSKTQDKPEQKDEVQNQKKREIADDVPKIAEEVQQKDEESELFSEVKESEPTEKESARKSPSDLVQKVKGTTKNEDTTTEPHMEEKLETEEEENEDEHNKDDKTSPDSLVMVEAKDTVSTIKTHKKSQGILSGVGSKVKHSISKVKKVLTGKSSHTTTKPSSPK